MEKFDLSLLEELLRGMSAWSWWLFHLTPIPPTSLGDFDLYPLMQRALKKRGIDTEPMDVNFPMQFSDKNDSLSARPRVALGRDWSDMVSVEPYPTRSRLSVDKCNKSSIIKSVLIRLLEFTFHINLGFPYDDRQTFVHCHTEDLHNRYLISWQGLSSELILGYLIDHLLKLSNQFQSA
ncbi:hypothetical protein CR513_35409, partial [Mucuna pruriens]